MVMLVRCCAVMVMVLCAGLGKMTSPGLSEGEEVLRTPVVDASTVTAADVVLS